MKKFADLVDEARLKIDECLPWDADEIIQKNNDVLILDIREEKEYLAYHIAGALFAPRGILESACEYDYEDTIPVLASARNKEIIVVCRSGNRSILACLTMQALGFNHVKSMKTGLKGWNDYDLPMVDGNELAVDADDIDAMLNAGIREDQKSPA